MKGKLQVAKFDTPPWNWELGVIAGPRVEANRFILKHVGTPNRIPVEAIGYAIFTDNKPVFVWVERLSDTPTLAHELMHAVFYVLGERGLVHSGDSEEAYTYLLSDLLERILAHKKWKRY